MLVAFLSLAARRRDAYIVTFVCVAELFVDEHASRPLCACFMPFVGQRETCLPFQITVGVIFYEGRRGGEMGGGESERSCRRSLSAQ